MSATLTPKEFAAATDFQELRTPRFLLNYRQMRMVLTKERLRSDRHDQFFGLIVIRLHCAKSDYRKRLQLFAALLSRRMRLTDECGMLAKGQIGIMLPMTDLSATRLVLDSITSLAADEGIQFRARIVSYPDQSAIFDNVDSLMEEDINANEPATIPMTLAEHSEVNPVSMSATSDTISVRCQTVSIGRPHEFVAPYYPVWKRGFDIAASSAGLLAAAPFLAAAAIAIRLTSKGPAFFLQPRTGQYGETFKIIKLRTMVQNADDLKSVLMERNERDGPAFKMKDDPRVTKIGHLLRRTGLDELPQLINVLKGEMAIVGPRPLPVAEDADCELWQRRRLDTKPGLTCYWQIAKSRKIPFVEWMRMDLRYGDKRSIFCDMTLVLKTVASVVLGRVGH